MLSMSLTEFIETYIPGLWILTGLLIVHIILSTIIHIKEMDFSFKEWPNYMIKFSLFIVFIVFANAILDLASIRLRNSLLENVFVGIQAVVYIQAIGYYLDNIVQHANKLGLIKSPELMSLIKNMTGQVRKTIIR